MRFSGFISILIFFLSSVSIATEETKAKLEELYIWKMSDELSLVPAEEKKFTEIIKSLNRRKAELNTQMQNSLAQMQSAKSDADKTKEFNKYKKSQQNYNRLSEEELDSLKNLLGIKRVVKYLEVKQDMTTRLKNLLANPETPGKKSAPSLPPPKIIEE